MNTFARVLLALSLVAAFACGKDDKKEERGGGTKVTAEQKAAAAITCDQTANKLSMALDGHYKVGGKLPQFAAAIAEACNAGAWPEDVRTCATGVDRKDLAGARACVEKLGDGKPAAIAAIDKAAAASGSTATW